MKRILFITSNDEVPWGGSEDLWYKTAKYALNQGHEIAICCKWNPLPEKLRSLNTDKNCTLIVKNKTNNTPLQKFNKFLPGRFHFKLDTNLYYQEILKWEPSILVISQGNNADGLEIIQFAIAHHIPYFTISQAVYEGIWPSTFKAEKMCLGFKHALRNYFVSKSNLNTTELQIGAQITNAKVIFNPFNVDYHNTITFPKVNEVYKLACVARFEFYAKGQDVLLQTLSLQKWRDRNIEVNFFGSGHNKAGIEKLIHHFKLSNAFINPYTDTAAIWKSHHALILPSRFEGLPLALVEAMLCGRFGIVTDVSGNKEVIIDNETGFIAEAPQVKYVDLALERAWQKRENWESIGEKARTEIKKIVPENPEIVLFNDIIN